MDKDDLIKHNEREQKFEAEIKQIATIYSLFEQPSAKIVIDKATAYITFSNLRNLQFIVKDIKHAEELSFIENKQVVNIQEYDNGFFKFLVLEFWQGSTSRKRALRLCHLLFVLIATNILLFSYGTEKSIQTTLTSILASVSVFIAIFSVFTANQTHFEKHRLSLFKSGKLAYYFSVDRNMTISGLVVIFTALAGVMIAKDSTELLVPVRLIDLISTSYSKHLRFSFRKVILGLSLNVAFLFTYITLRSLVEFYINRPARFEIGKAKDAFLKAHEGE